MEKDLRLIANISIDSDASGTIDNITEDVEGNTFSLKEVFVKVTCKGPTEHEQGSGGYNGLIMTRNNSSNGLFYGELVINSLPANNGAQKFCHNHYIALTNGIGYTTKCEENFNNLGNVKACIHNTYGSEIITSIQIKTTGNTYYIGPGTTIQIWGK